MFLSLLISLKRQNWFLNQEFLKQELLKETPDLLIKYSVALTNIANFMELSTRFTDDPNDLILAEIKQNISDTRE